MNTREPCPTCGHTQVAGHMTSRQKDVYDALCDYYAEHGIAPTLEWIAEALGIGTPTVHEHVQALLANGWVRKVARTHQSRLYAPRWS